jgi:hypothetical protein
MTQRPAKMPRRTLKRTSAQIPLWFERPVGRKDMSQHSPRARAISSIKITCTAFGSGTRQVRSRPRSTPGTSVFLAPLAGDGHRGRPVTRGREQRVEMHDRTGQAQGLAHIRPDPAVADIDAAASRPGTAANRRNPAKARRPGTISCREPGERHEGDIRLAPICDLLDAFSVSE